MTEYTGSLTWNDEEEQPASRQAGTKPEKLSGDAAAVDEICLAFTAGFEHKVLHLVSFEKTTIHQSILSLNDSTQN